MRHQQLAHLVIQGLAGGSPVGIADRPGKQRVGLLLPPRVIRRGSSIPSPPNRLIRRRSRVVADGLDDLDEAEGGPQPAEGRELVIVDLSHQP